MSLEALHPRIGIAVIVMRDGRVLLGQRRSALGNGTWAVPGGHLEFGESIEDCARREVLEETGLKIGAITPGPYTSNVFAAEQKHYVTLFVIAQAGDGEPEAREPDKCSGWSWVRWSEFPEPLFPSLETLRSTGFVPADVR
jgi:8-oxo-dGTP diphosphatase